MKVCLASLVAVTIFIAGAYGGGQSTEGLSAPIRDEFRKVFINSEGMSEEKLGPILVDLIQVLLTRNDLSQRDAEILSDLLNAVSPRDWVTWVKRVFTTTMIVAGIAVAIFGNPYSNISYRDVDVGNNGELQRYIASQ